MPYRLATPQQSYFSVSYFPNAVKHFYAFGKILIVFSAKSAIVSVIQNAPVAQLDRVSASEAEGRGFESRRAHQFKKNPRKGIFLLGRIDFQFYFRLFSIALIAAGNCPNAVISASARVPQYSCSP